MEESGIGLVECPWCGNIQEGRDKCVKCGKEMAASPSRGEVLPKVDAPRQAAAPQIPKEKPEPAKAPKGLKFEGEEPWAGASPSGDESGQDFSDTHTAAGESIPGRGPLIPVYLPVAKLLFLSIVTLGIYQLVWFHRNWKILKRYHDQWLDPGRLTLMMLIPVYGIYLAYRQFKGIHEMAGLSGRTFPVVPVLAAWFVLFGWVVLATRIESGILFFSAWLGSSFALMPVQGTLNRYALSIGEKVDSGESWKGWRAAAVGIVALVLCAGISDLVVRIRIMKPFDIETARLESMTASSSAETRELLIRYGDYIERSKALMMSRLLLKKQKHHVHAVTGKMIRELPGKLRCVYRDEAYQIHNGMIHFIVEGNTFLEPMQARFDIAMAEARTAMTARYYGAPKEELPACTSDPFDVNAFVEEMKRAKGLETAPQKSADQVSSPPRTGGRSRPHLNAYIEEMKRAKGGDTTPQNSADQLSPPLTGGRSPLR